MKDVKLISYQHPLLFSLNAACPKPEQCRNVALKSSVKTSSVMFGGKPEMIVDGHASTTFGENGHCLHFLPEVQPWIRIDLGESFLVYSVNVTTRDDGYNWGQIKTLP